MSKTLHRRTILRGLGGATVALPFLEIMMGRNYAQAAPIPKRFGIFFDGQSLGGDFDPNNYTIPTVTGANYPLSVGLKPLGTWNVQNDMTFVSGLRIPVGSGLAFRDGDFHADSHYPQIHGMPTTMRGEGADQIVARQIGAGTRVPTLNYQAQPDFYIAGYDFSGREILTFRNNSGTIVNVSNQTSPSAAYTALFTGFTPPDQDPALIQRELSRRRSILDLIAGDASGLLKRLGKSDSDRLSRHFDEIRDLEKRIATLPPAPMGACRMYANPGPDPTQGARYSDEFKRNRLFMDLIHMAYVCDMTRSATHMITTPQCHMDVSGIHPSLAVVQGDQHELGHLAAGNPQAPSGTPFVKLHPTLTPHPTAGSYAMSLVHAWHVDHFSYLVDKLKRTPEGTGTVLDNCALVFMWEGGHGAANNNGGDVKSIGSHTTENMAMMIAGKAGGLKPGKHIATNGAHPAKVTISAMKAVGATPTLGQISGELVELFS